MGSTFAARRAGMMLATAAANASTPMAIVITGTFTLSFDSDEAMHGSFAADVCSSIPPSLHGSSC